MDIPQQTIPGECARNRNEMQQASGGDVLERQFRLNLLPGPTRIRTAEKQIVGVTISSSIQNKGVTDQSSLKALAVNQAQAATTQTTEQMSSATDTADWETGL
jgi:hypothetical protein